MAEAKWRVHLGAGAERDFASILQWTRENFGARQSRHYRETITLAIRALAQGPDLRGSRARDDIMPGVRTLHVARHGRRGRHFILYRVIDRRIIEIGRILHDMMDVQRHRPFPNDEDKD